MVWYIEWGSIIPPPQNHDQISWLLTHANRECLLYQGQRSSIEASLPQGSSALKDISLNSPTTDTLTNGRTA